MSSSTPSFSIGDRTIGGEAPCYLIAEIGINHQGDPAIARDLIAAAADSGADAVKLQKRNVDRILTRKGLEMPYLNRHSFGDTYGEHKRALELSEADFGELRAAAGEQGVDFLASGWDEESIDFLFELGVPFFKMASADLTNLPLLEHSARKGRPLVLSTGMATMDEVARAYSVVRELAPACALLQCTSTYPSRFHEIDLRVLESYAAAFPDAVIGYSGHELGIAVSVVAAALGAKIVERHFTLDRTMKGGDHAASLEPQGFAKMVRDIRHVEQALGVAYKRLHESEVPIRAKLAKSIVTHTAIREGDTIRREWLTTKGPGSGISPAEMGAVVGRRAARDLEADRVLRKDDLA